MKGTYIYKDTNFLKAEFSTIKKNIDFLGIKYKRDYINSF